MSYKIINKDIEIFRQDQKVVLCQGCFDLVHIGHLRHLEAAKKYGDILVVAITADEFVNKGPHRPVFNQDLRLEAVASLEMVDYVILSEEPSALSVINIIKPDFFVKGSEYSDLDKDITGKISLEKAEVEKHGGQLVFTDEIVFSSTNLLNTFFNPISQEAQQFLNDFPYTSEDAIEYLNKIKDLKILVIGEAIFDKYSFVNVRNVAAKHSVLSSQFLNSETHCGGVLATARHLSQFCNNVDVLTCLSPTMESIWKDAQPSGKFLSISISEDRAIIKERFLDEKGKQLFRIDYLDDKPYEDLSNDICYAVDPDKYDLILVNDFGHGFITPTVLGYFNRIYHKTFFAVNAQTNSANKGFNLITKYSKANYVSIDLPEARLATHNRYGSVDILKEKLFNDIHMDTLSITHGKFGTHVFTPDSKFSAPVFTSETIDSTGAGDAYFALTSPLAFLNAPPEVIALIGNATGALATRIVGNRKSVDKVSLQKFITSLLG